MKKILIILTATLFITLTVKGQNLFFIGEESYPCTETITLQISCAKFPDFEPTTKSVNYGKYRILNNGS